MTGNPVR